MGNTKADRLTNPILTIFQLNGVLTDWRDNFAAPEQMSSAPWQMLGMIALAGRPLTAARMGSARQGAQQQFNQLVQMNLVEVHDNPMHKRSPLHALGQSGQIAFSAIDGRWRKHAWQLAPSFRAADLGTAVKVLTDLIAVHAPTREEQEHEA